MDLDEDVFDALYGVVQLVTSATMAPACEHGTVCVTCEGVAVTRHSSTHAEDQGAVLTRLRGVLDAAARIRLSGGGRAAEPQCFNVNGAIITVAPASLEASRGMPSQHGGGAAKRAKLPSPRRTPAIAKPQSPATARTQAKPRGVDAPPSIVRQPSAASGSESELKEGSPGRKAHDSRSPLRRRGATRAGIDDDGRLGSPMGGEDGGDGASAADDEHGGKRGNGARASGPPRLLQLQTWMDVPTSSRRQRKPTAFFVAEADRYYGTAVGSKGKPACGLENTLPARREHDRNAKAEEPTPATRKPSSSNGKCSLAARTQRSPSTSSSSSSGSRGGQCGWVSAGHSAVGFVGTGHASGARAGSFLGKHVLAMASGDVLGTVAELQHSDTPQRAQFAVGDAAALSRKAEALDRHVASETASGGSSSRNGLAAATQRPLPSARTPEATAPASAGDVSGHVKLRLAVPRTGSQPCQTTTLCFGKADPIRTILDPIRMKLGPAGQSAVFDLWSRLPSGGLTLKTLHEADMSLSLAELGVGNDAVLVPRTQ